MDKYFLVWFFFIVHHIYKASDKEISAIVYGVAAITYALIILAIDVITLL